MKKRQFGQGLEFNIDFDAEIPESRKEVFDTEDIG